MDEAQTRLIVMLTHHDRTVENAPEVFEACRGTGAEYWGMKEEGLPPERMRALYRRMQECGKKTALEVVAYTEAEGLQGAQLAAGCGCDLLMGTLFFDSIAAFCRTHGLRYLPFVGRVHGRPSVLDGTPEEMVLQAGDCLRRGAFGVDLLGYRHTGDKSALIRRFTAEVPAPVCVAGSIDSFARLAEIKRAAPWAFTIGSAFFEEKFGTGFASQIGRVLDFLRA